LTAPEGCFDVLMTYRSMFLPVILIVANSIAGANFSGKKACTSEEANAAENETDHLRDWASVHPSYVHFSHCDDGSIAEGYSDAVGKLLAEHWDQFSRLAQLVSNDKEFGRFVIKHIDHTLPNDVLLKISKSARSRCPVGREKYCAEIAHAASNN
jgi:hypothetical protein